MIDRFYLLRHGETECDKQQHFASLTDTPLTDEGLDEAVNASIRMSNQRITHIFSSTLQQSLTTAEAVTNFIDRSLVTTSISYFNERDYGDCVGESYADEEYIWRTSYVDRPTNGESLQDVVLRVSRGWDTMRALGATRRPLIVAHDDILRALLVYLGIRTQMEIAHITFESGIPYVVDLKTKPIDFRRL